MRYFNDAGAHINGKIGEDHRPESHLIPIILQVALRQREKIMIYGDDYATEDGTCIRDYIYAVIASRRLGDSAILIASSEKAKRELDWKPRYNSLEFIIETTWNWHRNHPYGYKK